MSKLTFFSPQATLWPAQLGLGHHPPNRPTSWCRERWSGHTGAPWAGYPAFPSISVPPTLTCTGTGGGWPSPASWKDGSIPFRMLPQEWAKFIGNLGWSLSYPTHVLLPPSPPPSSHSGFFLIPASRPLFLLSSAWTVLPHFFHVHPVSSLRSHSKCRLLHLLHEALPDHSNHCHLRDSAFISVPPRGILVPWQPPWQWILVLTVFPGLDEVLRNYGLDKWMTNFISLKRFLNLYYIRSDQ